MGKMHEFHLSGFIISWFARLLYLGSLTTLIPFGALVLASPEKFVSESLHYIPVTGFAFAGAGALILLLHYRNLAHVLATLGWATLIPGLGGLFFMVFQRDAFFAFLTNVFSGFSLIEPFAAVFQQTFPTIWLFVIGYVLIGLVLLHVAGRMEREHAVLEQFKKIFGPRVRVFRSR
jgi:hypothetical protein